MPRLAGWLAALALTGCAHAGDGVMTLTLERTIELPNVAGRIDHLAIDPQHQRLAVAELGNNSVDVIDIASGKVLHRIEGVGEPQGLAFTAEGGSLLVASRSDGGLHIYDTIGFELAATIPLGEDADNIRIDPRNGHAVIGYGDGALAVVDVEERTVLARIELGAHPEGFQIDARDGRAYVNLPDARVIGVVDLDRATVLSRWKLPLALFNYPMALDPAGRSLVSVFRAPSRLVQFDRSTGKETTSASTCGDADDVFYDAPRKRIYIACGDGGIDVFDNSGASLKWAAHAATRSGARTALFDPVLDRLFVAARSTASDKPAAILVFKPVD